VKIQSKKTFGPLAAFFDKSEKSSAPDFPGPSWFLIIISALGNTAGDWFPVCSQRYVHKYRTYLRKNDRNLYEHFYWYARWYSTFYCLAVPQPHNNKIFPLFTAGNMYVILINCDTKTRRTSSGRLKEKIMLNFCMRFGCFGSFEFIIPRNRKQRSGDFFTRIFLLYDGFHQKS
jgi:hypothetical protein